MLQRGSCRLCQGFWISPSDNRLSQQHEGLLKNELLHLGFGNSFKRVKRGYWDIIDIIGVYMNLYQNLLKWPAKVKLQAPVCRFVKKQTHLQLLILESMIWDDFNSGLFCVIGFWITTAQKINFSIKDFFSKCDQIRSLLRIWLCLLKKSIMENFIFCAVNPLQLLL